MITLDDEFTTMMDDRYKSLVKVLGKERADEVILHDSDDIDLPMTDEEIEAEIESGIDGDNA